ncbi:hypothetical protein BH09MYX1_BH09MYX1_14300 [soil metagenome]
MRFSLTTAVFIAAISAVAVPMAEPAHASPHATQRAVSGIVTQVDPALLTISPIQGGHKECITGRLDTTRTHVFIDGRPARAGDIKITQAVKGELALDDVWTVVRIDTTR